MRRLSHNRPGAVRLAAVLLSAALYLCAPAPAEFREPQALQLFDQGKKFVVSGDYERAAEQFKRLVQRHPHSPLCASARDMLALYDKMREESSGELLTLLRSAYEASFVDDQDTVYHLCDEILAARPDDDLRDRTQLLIAVAWYQSNGKGYHKIDKIFKDLFKHQVIEQQGDKLVLKKRLDFYFGLADSFPEMKLSEFTESVLEKLGPKGADVISPEERADSDKEPGRDRDDAQSSIDNADEKIGRADDRISEIESDRDRELDRQRSDLDDARDLQNEAKSLFEEGDYEKAKEKADEAVDGAAKITDDLD